jgi:lipopolysaccharide/colanic/teichoic acid biosynthesis glycosyltransferase
MSLYSTDVSVRESKLKRLFDVILSLTGLVVSSPLWLIISLAIWIEDGRPVFYSQTRVGKDGKLFNIIKFRSMNKHAERKTGPVWASENDERTTKVGRFLRATAMDELPQLLNILIGHMSFVGPRPERPELLDEFCRTVPNFKKRLLVKPGLTGLAQVFGQYDTPPKHKVKYDLLYIRSRSFFTDLKLILLSFLITILGRWECRGKKLVRRRLKKRLRSLIRERSFLL